MLSNKPIARSAILTGILLGAYAVAAAAGAENCYLTRKNLFADVAACGKPKNGSLSWQSLTVAGIRVGKATLDDVQARFSGAQKFRLQKGESSPVGICVKNKAGDAAAFISGSSGGWKDLTGIYLAKADLLENQGATCVQIPDLGAIATENGLHPGMDRESFFKKLGLRPVRGENVAFHYMTSAEKAPWQAQGKQEDKGSAATEQFKALTGVYAGFSVNRIEWLFLYGTESD
ncbi:MAG TPA: hypothetical protein VHV32_16360 [Candidatus Angelobacter sp.]|jgi:hypothetical protein|nr:hypothetical protein [Candidatus Angelobacter sp.]